MGGEAWQNQNTYGAAANKSPIVSLSTGRKRLNLFALLWLLVLPCLAFFLLNALMSFSARLTSPFFMWIVIICFLLLIMNFAWKACSAASATGGGFCGAFFPCCAGGGTDGVGGGLCGGMCPCAGGGAAAVSLQGAGNKSHGNDASIFYVLIFWSLVAAFIFAILSGQINFQRHTGKYYAITKLNTYMSVDPSRASGEQLMDAGRVMFTPGSRLDLAKSMAFVNKNAYCVSPIGKANETDQSSFDMWAVGVNCCAGGRFACPEYNNPAASGGRRLLNDQQRAYFRLAVQQAEATYNITAPHPIFFYWMQDPFAEISAHHRKGVVNYGLLCGAFFVFQLCIVGAALFFFLKEAQE